MQETLTRTTFPYKNVKHSVLEIKAGKDSSGRKITWVVCEKHHCFDRWRFAHAVKAIALSVFTLFISLAFDWGRSPWKKAWSGREVVQLESTKLSSALQKKLFPSKPNKIVACKKEKLEMDQEVHQNAFLHLWSKNWEALLYSTSDEKTKNYHLKTIFDQTQHACNQGYYHKGLHVELDPLMHKESVQCTELLHPSPVALHKKNLYKTIFSVSAKSPFEVGHQLQQKGLNPAVLCSTTEGETGGHVQQGAVGGHEQELFRRSNFFSILSQKFKKSSFPVFGDEVLYTPGVQVFRSKRFDHFYQKKTEISYLFHFPYAIDVIACPAFDFKKRVSQYANKVTLEKFHQDPDKGPIEIYMMGDKEWKDQVEKEVTNFRINLMFYENVLETSNFSSENCKKAVALLEKVIPDYTSKVKERMRNILRAAALKGHDSIVLDHFGQNDPFSPKRINLLYFKEILKEEEFKGVFKNVVFTFKFTKD